MTFPFIVSETQAPKRAIVLQGRCLPYQGVAWGGTMQHDMAWYPGNPKASTQIIGPRHKPTTIRGTWKDIFMFDQTGMNVSKIINFPLLSTVATPESIQRGGNTFLAGPNITGDQNARLARVLRDAFEMLREGGGEVKVEWGSLVRYGIIAETTFTHAREEDIEFEIEFAFSGKTDAFPKKKKPKPELLSLLKLLLQLLDEIINTLLGAIFQASMWVTRVTQFITKIGSFVTELMKALEKIASFTFAPAQVLATIRSQLTAIKLATRDLFKTLNEGRSAVIEAAFTGDPLLMVLNGLAEGRLRRAAQDLAALAAKQEGVIADLIAPALLGVVLMPGGQSLRDLASRFYDGNPDAWQLIADFNGFSGSVVAPGTLVRIPATAA